MPSINKQPDAVLMAWYRAKKFGPVRSAVKTAVVVTSGGGEMVIPAAR